MTTHHTTNSKHKLLSELETYTAGGVRHQQEQLQRQRKRSLSLYESTTTGDAQNGATTRRRLQEQPLTEASPEKQSTEEQALGDCSSDGKPLSLEQIYKDAAVSYDPKVRNDVSCDVICHFLSLHTEELSLLPFHLSKLSNNTFYYIPKQNDILFSGINDGDENKDENNILEEDTSEKSTPSSLYIAEYESRVGEKRTDAAEGGRHTKDDVPVTNEEDAWVGEGKPCTLVSSFLVCMATHVLFCHHL